MEKDVELVQVPMKSENQETELCHHQQQKEKLQQQYGDSKKTRKLELTKSNKVLSSNTKEISRLWNHNKTLITKIKKLKNNSKKEQFGEDLEGIILEKQEENQCLNNRNQELQNQIEEVNTVLVAVQKKEE